MVRFCIFSTGVLVLLAGCRDVQESPLNQPPEILSIQAPSFVSANDTIFVKTYDFENDSLSLKVSVSTAAGNSVGTAFSKLFTDDGLSGDYVSNDHVFTGIVNRSALLAQVTSQFEFVFTVSEKGKNPGVPQSVIISQNPANAHPPVISNLNAPDTVNTSLQTQFLITIAVSDPEGLSDVLSVTRKTPSGLVLNLNDNGSNGDASAGDGIYSELVLVNPPPPNGSYLFTFQATDRLGLKSNSIQKTIVIIN
ncbi:hypothetical protein JNL27_12235 [bacterium]|nr:hypothetical protein [bacterium]